jgi:transketolase
MDNIENYKKTATEARKKVIELIYKAQTSHIGSNFSCIDILTVLFEKADLDKDKIILSKGWAAASLYYFLWKKGRITEEELNSYCQQITCPECNGSGFEDGK